MLSQSAQRAACLALLAALTALATPSLRAAAPTAEELYWLQLVNRARSDPAAELARLVNFSSPTTYGAPPSSDPAIAAALSYFGTDPALLYSQFSTIPSAAPLAWSNALGTSSDLYSQSMVNHDAQSHMLDTAAPTESQAIRNRILAAGYSGNYLSLGENLYAAAASTSQGHAGFLVDWGDDDTNPLNGFGTGIQNPAGHREVTLDPLFKEFGIGVLTSGIPGTNAVATGPVVVTQHFANKFRQSGVNYFSDAILTGVIYADTVAADNFYTPGEGLAGELIQIYNNTTNALLFSGSTNSAGGFDIAMPGVLAGDVLRVSAPGTGLPDQIYTATGFTTDASVYGAPVNFTNNIGSNFQLAPEPGSAVLSCIGLLLLARRRRERAHARQSSTFG